MLVVLLCVMGAASSHAFSVVFENFEHVSGFNETVYDLRVRKFNRTTKALNGSVIVMHWIENNVKLSLDLFHSRLGNQQFNHYPMKLPTCGICDFIDNLHTNYKEAMDKLENIPAKGECPFSPRSINVWDFVFPSEVLPPVMPRGLWKALVTGVRDGQPLYSYYFLAKASDDL